MDLQPLPFYKTHPGIYTIYGGQGPLYRPGVTNDHALMQDYEYFCQLCPEKIKKYQQRIDSILEKLDFEGSMIYDEYPDRFSLERTADRIADVISAERKAEDQSFEKEQEYPLIFILLEIEICKRRHGGKRNFYI